MDTRIYAQRCSKSCASLESLDSGTGMQISILSSIPKLMHTLWYTTRGAQQHQYSSSIPSSNLHNQSVYQLAYTACIHPCIPSTRSSIPSRGIPFSIPCNQLIICQNAKYFPTITGDQPWVETHFKTHSQFQRWFGDIFTQMLIQNTFLMIYILCGLFMCCLKRIFPQSFSKKPGFRVVYAVIWKTLQGNCPQIQVLSLLIWMFCINGFFYRRIQLNTLVIITN